MPEYACRACFAIQEWKYATPLKCPLCEGVPDWKRLDYSDPTHDWRLTAADRVFLKVNRIMANTVMDTDDGA